ncbi:MAG: DUF1349 domain-containing protein [Cyanobacteria bacterium P01_A01_bin.135]
MLNLTQASWINEPKTCEVTSDKVVIITEEETDLWQRSYYGFRRNNAPGLLLEINDNFSFTTRAKFEYRNLFDQCGVIVYLDEENWFKASVEYENEDFSRLGSVVTNLGYSDWATTDIKPLSCIWYRLSRRGPDFLIESSFDSYSFKQMRIFHLHQLGKTTVAMGKANPPRPANSTIRFGVYACSPLQSSFIATFTELCLEPCKWQAHKA